MVSFKEVIRNKYIVTGVGLLVWVLFFDKNDFTTMLKLHKQVSGLIEERDYYKDEISRINQELKELTGNPQALEKFAREKYLMKRDNEDIFVIIRE